MLRILCVTEDNKTQEIIWKVGSKLPTMPVSDVEEIHADGKELAHIVEIGFGGIERKTVKWYGDLARTIYLNL